MGLSRRHDGGALRHRRHLHHAHHLEQLHQRDGHQALDRRAPAGHTTTHQGHGATRAAAGASTPAAVAPVVAAQSEAAASAAAAAAAAATASTGRSRRPKNATSVAAPATAASVSVPITSDVGLAGSTSVNLPVPSSASVASSQQTSTGTKAAGLSTGALWGIVAGGIVLALAILVVGAWFCIKRRNKKRGTSASIERTTINPAHVVGVADLPDSGSFVAGPSSNRDEKQLSRFDTTASTMNEKHAASLGASDRQKTGRRWFQFGRNKNRLRLRGESFSEHDDQGPAPTSRKAGKKGAQELNKGGASPILGSGTGTSPLLDQRGVNGLGPNGWERQQQFGYALLPYSPTSPNSPFSPATSSAPSSKVNSPIIPQIKTTVFNESDVEMADLAGTNMAASKQEKAPTTVAEAVALGRAQTLRAKERADRAELLSREVSPSSSDSSLGNQARSAALPSHVDPLGISIPGSDEDHGVQLKDEPITRQADEQRSMGLKPISGSQVRNKKDTVLGITDFYGTEDVASDDWIVNSGESLRLSEVGHPGLTLPASAVANSAPINATEPLRVPSKGGKLRKEGPSPRPEGPPPAAPDSLNNKGATLTAAPSKKEKERALKEAKERAAKEAKEAKEKAAKEAKEARDREAREKAATLSSTPSTGSGLRHKISLLRTGSRNKQKGLDPSASAISPYPTTPQNAKSSDQAKSRPVLTAITVPPPETAVTAPTPPTSAKEAVPPVNMADILNPSAVVAPRKDSFQSSSSSSDQDAHSNASGSSNDLARLNEVHAGHDYDFLKKTYGVVAAPHRSPAAIRKGFSVYSQKVELGSGPNTSPLKTEFAIGEEDGSDDEVSKAEVHADSARMGSASPNGPMRSGDTTAEEPLHPNATSTPPKQLARRPSEASDADSVFGLPYTRDSVPELPTDPLRAVEAPMTEPVMQPRKDSNTTKRPAYDRSTTTASQAFNDIGTALMESDEPAPPMPPLQTPVVPSPAAVHGLIITPSSVDNTPSSLSESDWTFGSSAPPSASPQTPSPSRRDVLHELEVSPTLAGGRTRKASRAAALAAQNPGLKPSTVGKGSEWTPLGQMNLATAQPDYHSPTYSIYGVYGDENNAPAVVPSTLPLVR